LTEPATTYALTARDLHFSYNKNLPEAVAGIDLQIPKGEIYGLLGPNGAGKTTSISLLCTLFKPQAGSIEICGIDALHQPRKARAHIGLVPQEIALYPQLTARENLAYFGRLYELGGRKLKERIELCLELVGLGEHADKRIETYSGGMKRRANLAAGIVHQPEVLFLDEPTVGIDAQSRTVLLANLRQLQQEGMTMIYTTHYMEEAEQLCPRLAIIDSGKIIAEGKPTDLIAAQDGCHNLEELFLRMTGRQLRD
jgi:ABC-2 type transport system ATP-binding protein